MVAKDVNCHVESCKYQSNGCCQAKCIQVNNCHCQSAKELSQTACDTFELK